MKTETGIMISSLNKSIVDQLHTETKEINGSTMPRVQTKNFSLLDLWHIQRRHKTINQRRRFVY